MSNNSQHRTIWIQYIHDTVSLYDRYSPLKATPDFCEAITFRYLASDKSVMDYFI